MTQEAITDTTSDTAAPIVPATDAPATDDTATAGRGRRGQGGDNRRNERRPRRGARPERQKPEFDQKIISIRRVTRVMGGGRRFSFSVAMVIGDKRGKVGVGIGKAGDTQLAIEKAIRNAKKNMITVTMNKDSHIPHDVHVKYASSEVMMMPAKGRGLVAGSSVRTVLELAGVKDITAKIFSRSKNKLNNARAAVEALKQLKK
jgi:small subunit ribosomal protein S5